MNATQIEKAYEKRLCRDYKLLYDFAEKGFNLICCFSEKEDFGTTRKPYMIRNDHSFDSMYLAFLDEHPDKKEELFITFCKIHDLTFILP
jgi:hypothetical protein